MTTNAAKANRRADIVDRLEADNERLRAALATVAAFIDGEPIASAIIVPEGASVTDPNNPTLLRFIESALDPH